MARIGYQFSLSGTCHCSFFPRSTCWQWFRAFKWLGQCNWNKFQCCFCVSRPDRTMEGVSIRQLKGSGWVSKIYSHLGLQTVMLAPKSLVVSPVRLETSESQREWEGQGEGCGLWQETSEGQEWIKGKRETSVVYLSLNRVNGWKVPSKERSGI